MSFSSILLVEDDASVRSLICDVLALEQLPHQAFAHPAEARLWFQSDHADPALLVCDITLPGMDGQELVEWIRRFHPALRVLFISGWSNRPLKLGPLDSFLAKPFRVEEFLRRVQEMAGSSTVPVASPAA